ncbi:Sensor protein FixL [Chryseobacterium aquaeductus]|uniref:histidine kinase n=1 Tax=Chryseobacterium aquaeductus TaxID=2675056 RepID=A0A9N8QSE1_9FLAO|nr:ATP-binding protein [Chryseobacterium aquaeductus]CAA7330899.1 Sensor protein FixL [Chryseobacterium potabilaquae]CAD7806871.1 Sensor protein FixL [Chryseobacterium aquaeductus]
MNEKLIREELERVLKEEPNSYGRILELSTKLSSFDNNNVRFSVDAGVIDRLGSELVARQETAVSELVKNAYDADATKVKIKFENSDSVGGILYIEDNGTGMNREQLINGFMRISSTSKIHNPLSETYKRKRAGQKGIGRFAVQRLGEKLTITTQTEIDDMALVLSINWKEYENDLDLSSITNKIFIKPKTKEKGTILKIEGLKDKWSEASIKRIYNYVGDILQPFPLSEIDDSPELEDVIIDPGFKVYFSKIVNDRQINIADEKTMVYNHATAIIEGTIDLDGIGMYSVESKKIDLYEIGYVSSDPDNENIPFTELRNVKFRAYYFIYNSDLIPKMQESTIRKLARTQGGIRLYRNGFRVLPYGEPNNDWLGLDASTVKRSILPVHANINFFGFVELIDRDNDFNETSSREGLVENEALIQLRNFIYRTIMTAIIKIAEVRNVKIVSGQKEIDGIYESVEIRIKNIAFTLEELDRELEKDSSSVEVKRRRKKKIQQVQKEIEELQKAQEEEKDQYLKERSMLRVLSSVGLTIALFIHEVKDYILNMDSDINFLLEKLRAEEQVFKRLLILQSNVETFKSYTSYFDTVISQNIVRNLIPIEAQNRAEEFWENTQNDAKKSNIIFDKPIRNGYYLFTTPMHPSEWSSILFNLYTNAKKAIKRSKNQGVLDLECGKIDNRIFMKFSDTGDGINDDIKDRIFEEFFTTSSPNTLDNISTSNEVTGTGLGLKIVKDILSSYRGKIYVDEPKDGFSTTIYIEIPKANDKELDKYGL